MASHCSVSETKGFISFRTLQMWPWHWQEDSHISGGSPSKLHLSFLLHIEVFVLFHVFTFFFFSIFFLLWLWKRWRRGYIFFKKLGYPFQSNFCLQLCIWKDHFSSLLEVWFSLQILYLNHLFVSILERHHFCCFA